MRTYISAIAISCALSLSCAHADGPSPYTPSPYMVGSSSGSHAQTSSAPVMVMPSQYDVHLNKTVLVKLPVPASAVVVGNPNIADVSIYSSDTVMLVGKGYGSTNLLVLNTAGEMIMNADVTVKGPADRRNVRLFNGGAAARYTFNCAPSCEPAPVLGDDVEYITNNSNSDEAISNNVAPGPTSTQTSRPEDSIHSAGVTPP